MLTPTQLAERSKGIGASEAGAILGLDPFTSPYDVWLRKTGKVGDVETNDAIEWGNDLEEVIGRRSARVLKCCVHGGYGTHHHPNGVMLANIDFMADLPEYGLSPLEAKSTGIMDGWGEDDSDQVPDRVWAQVQVQMMCSKTRVAKVARLLGRYGFKFTIYTVQLADPDMQNVIEERLCDFWHNNVQKDIPPDNSVPSIENIARVKRVGQVVPVDPVLVSAFLKANTARKEAEKLEEKCKAALLASLRTGDGQYAEAGECEAGTVTYREYQRKGYVVEPSSYRKLDVKPTKGAGS